MPAARRVLVEETRTVMVTVHTDDLFDLPALAVAEAHKTPYATWDFVSLDAKPVHGTGSR